MHDLIKIENTPSGPSLRDTTIGDESVPTVSARELHEFLGSKAQFSDWIKKRLGSGKFLENKDYLVFHEKMKNPSGGRPLIEYYLTLETAKHFAMMERTDKGYEIREYFIQCEKELKSSKQKFLLDIIMARDDVSKALALNAYERGYVQPLEQYKEEAAPKVSYYDKVLSCTNTVPIKNIAQDYGMSSQRMNKLLHDLGVQYKEGGVWKLYVKHLNQGYARLETYVLNAETPQQQVRQNLRWTQKGRLFIYDLLKSKDILPVCELEPSEIKDVRN